ncbi:MAG: hypothetical protein R3D34_17565 [Nitratireductor sp.]
MSFTHFPELTAIRIKRQRCDALVAFTCLAAVLVSAVTLAIVWS